MFRYQALIPVTLCALLLSACQQYVTRTEFDQTVGELRASDSDLGNQIREMNDLFGELSGDFHSQMSGQDARISQIEGTLRVDTTVHFKFADATLQPQDRPVLDHFINVVRDRQNNIIITVEGFTDPAGDPEYNKWLGLQRAKAVADYLVNVGGLDTERVRAVSYGEDSERLIKPGEWGTQGAANRRVALVIDYVGGSAG